MSWSDLDRFESLMQKNGWLKIDKPRNILIISDPLLFKKHVNRMQDKIESNYCMKGVANNDHCPFCERDKEGKDLVTRVLFSVYDLDEKQFKLWDTSLTNAKVLKSILDQYKPTGFLAVHVEKISRNKYSIFPIQVSNLSQNEFLEINSYTKNNPVEMSLNRIRASAAAKYKGN